MVCFGRKKRPGSTSHLGSKKKRLILGRSFRGTSFANDVPWLRVCDFRVGPVGRDRTSVPGVASGPAISLAVRRSAFAAGRCRLASLSTRSHPSPWCQNKERTPESGIRSLLAPRLGFEPRTNALTAHCSTAELPRNALRRGHNSTAAGFCKIKLIGLLSDQTDLF